MNRLFLQNHISLNNCIFLCISWHFKFPRHQLSLVFWGFSSPLWKGIFYIIWITHCNIFMNLKLLFSIMIYIFWTLCLESSFLRYPHCFLCPTLFLFFFSGLYLESSWFLIKLHLTAPLPCFYFPFAIITIWKYILHIFFVYSFFSFNKN